MPKTTTSQATHARPRGGVPRKMTITSDADFTVETIRKGSIHVHQTNTLSPSQPFAGVRTPTAVMSKSALGNARYIESLYTCSIETYNPKFLALRPGDRQAVNNIHSTNDTGDVISMYPQDEPHSFLHIVASTFGEDSDDDDNTWLSVVEEEAARVYRSVHNFTTMWSSGALTQQLQEKPHQADSH